MKEGWGVGVFVGRGLQQKGGVGCHHLCLRSDVTSVAPSGERRVVGPRWRSGDSCRPPALGSWEEPEEELRKEEGGENQCSPPGGLSFRTTQ